MLMVVGKLRVSFVVPAQDSGVGDRKAAARRGRPSRPAALSARCTW